MLSVLKPRIVQNDVWLEYLCYLFVVLVMVVNLSPFGDAMGVEDGEWMGVVRSRNKEE
jgi:hypothetical protein